MRQPSFLDLEQDRMPALALPVENNTVAIIGGGWYGCHLALALSKEGYFATIFEKQSGLFQGISGGFSVRLHTGPHYPRSLITRKGCREGFRKFCETYPELINWHEYSIYALGEKDALNYPPKVGVQTFRDVCNEFQFKKEININNQSVYKNVLAVFDINEPSIVLGEPLRQAFQRYLKSTNVVIICDYTVKIVQKIDNTFVISDGVKNHKFHHVINTSSYQAMLPIQPLPFDMEIVYQPCLALIYQDTYSSRSTRPFSFIVMDGWFPCLMPCDDTCIENSVDTYKKYILTHSLWTILGSYKTPDEASRRLASVNDAYIAEHVRPACEKSISHFWVEFAKRFVYLKWIGAVLAKIKTEVEFRSAVTFQDRNSDMIYVIPGKISNIFDVEAEVVSLIRQQNISNVGHYRYIQQGVLDDAAEEIKEKPIDVQRNTCELQAERELYTKKMSHLTIFKSCENLDQQNGGVETSVELVHA